MDERLSYLKRSAIFLLKVTGVLIVLLVKRGGYGLEKSKGGILCTLAYIMHRDGIQN